MDIHSFQPMQDKSAKKNVDSIQHKADANTFQSAYNGALKTVLPESVQSLTDAYKSKLKSKKDDIETGEGMSEDSIEDMSEFKLMSEIKKRVRRLAQIQKHYIGL